MDDYQGYLDTKYWQQIKREMYLRYKKCQICGTTKNLEVHHLSYDHLGKERFNNLRLLCRTCHHRCHFTLFRNRKIPLTHKDLKRRYLFVKHTYKFRTTRPSDIINWFVVSFRIE